MARKCQVSKKRGLVGNNVSHSKRRIKRVQRLNLQWKRFWNPETKRWVRLRVTAKILKTIGTKGLLPVLRKYKVINLATK
jgi:large subunit ribosomal protein L28